MTTYRTFGRNVPVPQTKPIPDSGQVANSAGGFSWELDKWGKLERFLVLGTEGGTYYIKEQDLTQQNADNVIACIKEDGRRVIEMLTGISMEGRAARNDPALFVLALVFVHGDENTKWLAKGSLKAVARTGTHIFHFAQMANNMRGWGSSLKTAVSGWLDEKNPDSLAYQAVKYRQRDGWTFKDILTLSHPRNPENAGVYNWIMATSGNGNHEKVETNLRIIEGFEKAQVAKSANEAASLILEYRLPREAVPTQFLDDINVWDALLQVDMGLEAMIRNLGNMGKVGLLKPLSSASKRVAEILENEEALKRSRIHPIKILTGIKVYGQGHGVRGDGKWEVVPQIKDALESAFYKSFGNIEPTGKNILLGLDVSGSMSSRMMNLPFLSCAEASAVLAMVTARVEKQNFHMVAFSDTMKELNISATDSLKTVMRKTSGINFGRTDCAQPMLYAKDRKLDVDCFAIYTDSETYAGGIHPSRALEDYRKSSGRKAKLAVLGMTSNGFTIADPRDAGMMDFVGFDTNTPDALATFMRD